MHRPRKRFGQNFLRDQHILDRIITAAELSPGESILEIGPGPGALTERLLAAGVDLLVVEIDRDLGAKLEERNAANLTVVVGDVLRLDWCALLTTPPYKLIANLPYNISSQVLFKILEHRREFTRLVLMFQKEVGERLMAQPSTKEYGILSVLVQTWFEVSRVVRVPARAFFPPPKVESVVVQLTPREQPLVDLRDEEIYRRLVKGAFGQRRKTLRNSLLGSGWDAALIDRVFPEAGINSGRRGETLNIEEFGRLANLIAEQTGESQNE